MAYTRGVNFDPVRVRAFRLQGLWAWLLLALAGALGLFLAVWFLATTLVAALILVPALYAWLWWQRFKLRHRRLPPPY